MFTKPLAESSRAWRSFHYSSMNDQLEAIRRESQRLHCGRCGHRPRFRCAHVEPGPVVAVQFRCAVCSQLLTIYGETDFLPEQSEAVGTH